MVHGIFDVIYKSKEIMFCWGIHVSTESNGKILNTIASLKSDVHVTTNPVIEGSFIWFLNLFQIFSNNRCSHEKYLFKVSVHWK